MMKTIPVRKIAPSQTGKTQSGRFSIRTIEQVLSGKALVHDLHKHDFYFVLALRQGAGIHEIDFIRYEVHGFCIFILRPGQVHRLELTAPSTGFLMEFDSSFYQTTNTVSEQRWKKAASKNYCKVVASRFLKLNNILGNILDEFSTRSEGYLDAIIANLDLFFIEYVRQSEYPQQIAKTENGYTQDRFEELLRLLETNIGTIKSVSQYAELLSLSPYQLNAITKASVAKTVSDLIDEQIILEAKRYLLATPNQIKEIASHLGYEDPSYFIRFFKKRTGLSPDAFRKNFK